MKSSKLARKIALACYPEYKGRKIRVESRSCYFMQDYWSEGSRNYVTAYNLATGETRYPTELVHNPMETPAHARLEIPAGWALVENAIFCGKDCGISIIVNPAADKAGLLQEVR